MTIEQVKALTEQMVRSGRMTWEAEAFVRQLEQYNAAEEQIKRLEEQQAMLTAERGLLTEKKLDLMRRQGEMTAAMAMALQKRREMRLRVLNQSKGVLMHHLVKSKVRTN